MCSIYNWYSPVITTLDKTNTTRNQQTDKIYT